MVTRLVASPQQMTRFFYHETKEIFNGIFDLTKTIGLLFSRLRHMFVSLSFSPINVPAHRIMVPLSHINPLVTNGLSHSYHFDESTFIFKGHQEYFIFIFISFFDDNQVIKQNSPRWDAAFCGVTCTSGAILFAYIP